MLYPPHRLPRCSQDGCKITKEFKAAMEPTRWDAGMGPLGMGVEGGYAPALQPVLFARPVFLRMLGVVLSKAKAKKKAKK